MNPKQSFPPLHSWPFTDNVRHELYNKLSNAHPGLDFNKALYQCLQNMNHIRTPSSRPYQSSNLGNPSNTYDIPPFPTGRNGNSQRSREESYGMYECERSGFINSMNKNNPHPFGRGNIADPKRSFSNQSRPEKNSNLTNSREMSVHNVYNFFNVNSPHIYNNIYNNNRNDFHTYTEQGNRPPTYSKKDGVQSFYGKENTCVNNNINIPQSYPRNPSSVMKSNQSSKENNMSKWYKLPESSSLSDQSKTITHTKSSDCLPSRDDRQCMTVERMWESDNCRQSPESTTEMPNQTTIVSKNLTPSQSEVEKFSLFNVAPSNSCGNHQNSTSMMRRSPSILSPDNPLSTHRNPNVNVDVSQLGNRTNNSGASCQQITPAQLSLSASQDERRNLALQAAHMTRTPPISWYTHHTETLSHNSSAAIADIPLDFSSDSSRHRRHSSSDKTNASFISKDSNFGYSTRDVDLLNFSNDYESSLNRARKRKSDESHGLNAKRRISDTILQDDFYNIHNCSSSYNRMTNQAKQSDRLVSSSTATNILSPRQLGTANMISERESIVSSDLSNNANISELRAELHNRLMDRIGNDCQASPILSQTLRLPVKINSNPGPNSSNATEMSQQLLSSAKRKKKKVPTATLR